jgi:hypothetical protein
MAPKTVQAKAHAAHQPRDSHGHFIKSSNATLSSKIETPISNIIPELEKPIISVSINNPLKKIMYWLNQVRRHQTTTLALKISIPLIVIPVIVISAFSIGRISGLDIINQNTAPIPTITPIVPAPITISRAGILKVAKSQTQTSYILSLQNGDVLILEVPTTIDLTKYANKQILVTGLLNQTTYTLKVSDIAEVQIFNPTIIPAEATPSAQ